MPSQTEGFLIAGGAGTNLLATSTDDGVTWTGRTVPFTTRVWGAAWNGAYWVAVGEGTTALATSPDGVNWTSRTTPFTVGYGVAWNGTLWVAVGSGTHTIAYSYNGITWTGAGTTLAIEGRGVAWNGSLWVAVGSGTGPGSHTIATSLDGITWTGRGVAAFRFSALGVTWTGARWIAVGTIAMLDIAIAYSTDGISWTKAAGGTLFNTARAVAWNGQLAVAVGLPGAAGTYPIATSPDGVTWTARVAWTLNASSAYGIAWNGTNWVAGADSAQFAGAGANHTIATSPDGITWTGRGTSTFSTTCYGVAARRVLPNVGTTPVSTIVSVANQPRLEVYSSYVRISPNLGVGMIPTVQLQLSSDSTLKPTSSTWGITSDERIKQDIQDADTEICYDIVKNLKLKRFTWDPSFLPSIPDRRSVGWIAQEVEAVFPRAVTVLSNDWFSDFRTLDVDQIYKTLYGAVEKLIADKEALEAKYEALLARVAALEGNM